MQTLIRPCFTKAAAAGWLGALCLLAASPAAAETAYWWRDPATGQRNIVVPLRNHHVQLCMENTELSWQENGREYRRPVSLHKGQTLDGRPPTGQCDFASCSSARQNYIAVVPERWRQTAPGQWVRDSRPLPSKLRITQNAFRDPECRIPYRLEVEVDTRRLRERRQRPVYEPWPR